jgi:hypothetical protein
MRKILLASTALVALTSVSAMAADDYTISGSMDAKYTMIDDDDTTTDQDSFASTTDLDFGFSNVTDSGIEMSLSIGFSDGSNDDSSLKISGDFGTVAIEDGGGDSADDGGAVSGLDVDVDGYTNDEGATGTAAYAGGFGGVTTADDTISYTLPSMMDGLTVAVAMSDKTSDAKGAAYGVSYSGATDAIGFKIVAAAASNDNGTVETDDMHYGIEVSSGAITIGMAQNSRDKSDDTTQDRTSTEYGIKYGVSDVLTIGAFNRSAETGTASEDYSMTAWGATYTIAPGLTTSLTVTDTDVSASDKDSRAVIALEASF